MVAPLPKVSVLVPCYNDGRFLDEALASIAAQSFGDFEVVVSDDASSDDSPAIADAWSTRDPRFRLLRNAENLGMTENWNRALAAARGELVAKLDGDDALALGFLAALVGELDAYPAVTVAFCRTLDCDERLSPLAPYPGDDILRAAGLDPEARLLRSGLEWLPLALEGHQLWTSNAQLHRRRELVKAGGWDARWLSSDQELILRVLERNRPVVHHPCLGIRYRRRPGSHRDGVQRQGWGVVEGVLLPLQALDRLRAQSAFRRSRRVRFNWWRLWTASRRIMSDRGLWDGMPSELRHRYMQALSELRSPPQLVRLEGSARLLAWRLLKAPARGDA